MTVSNFSLFTFFTPFPLYIFPSLSMCSSNPGAESQAGRGCESRPNGAGFAEATGGQTGRQTGSVNHNTVHINRLADGQTDRGGSNMAADCFCCPPFKKSERSISAVGLFPPAGQRGLAPEVSGEGAF